MSQYSEADDIVITAMETYGGSFVKALAVCFRRADKDNYAILKASFPHYWHQYTDFPKNQGTTTVKPLKEVAE